jgi:TRAP-type transport system periplasmic protein
MHHRFFRSGRRLNRFALSFFLFKSLSFFHPHISYAAEKAIVIKMATSVPSGSSWHELLKEMANEWQEKSKGQVVLRIYPGGVAGSEIDVIRKMRIGQIHAAAASIGALSRIDPGVNVLAIPMAVDSRKALERIQNALCPRIERSLEDKGFIILNWGFVGWIRFFGPDSIPSVAGAQNSKMCVTAGDDRVIEVWKQAGFNPVPLAETDILTGLQTGMANAFRSTAVLALASQWFAFSPYMIDLPWAPLVGATIINKNVWETIPDSLRIDLKQIAFKYGNRLQSEMETLEQQAVNEMVKRGLTVLRPDEAQIQEWRDAMEGAYPKLRGEIIPEEWFDDALSIVKEIRKSKNK